MIRRGEIRWADLGPPIGSAPAYRRPVLVVSADSFNRSRIATVVVVAITSDLRLGGAPGNVELASDDSGLSKHSVINVSQIATLDESQLSDVIGTVEREVMRRVETGMARVLELSS